jgi:zinc D-Ala-D-Ala carboxypeptidase
MRLSANFTLEEFIASETAARRGIDNWPPAYVIDNLTLLAKTLEHARILLDHAPIIINSGYRGPTLNALVGGAVNSAHMRGLAVDFIAPRYGTPIQVATKLSMDGIFMSGVDQLIHEFGSWVHLGILPTGTPRGQLLTIDRTGTSLGLRSIA